jgi:nitrogen fixation/metabolism regulation signal transduction histidine kinase
MKGDVTMLRQVLHNLMQNAQDALNQVENPEIQVQTTFDEALIKLTVKDNGQGFPVDLLSHAFEPYVTTKVHGTGLGLAIVKKVIEEHFGQIKIENNLAGGACITIALPIENSISKPHEPNINSKTSIKNDHKAKANVKKQATLVTNKNV